MWKNKGASSERNINQKNMSLKKVYNNYLGGKKVLSKNNVIDVCSEEKRRANSTLYIIPKGPDVKRHFHDIWVKNI